MVYDPTANDGEDHIQAVALYDRATGLPVSAVGGDASNAKLDELKALLTTLNTYVDGLEGLNAKASTAAYTSVNSGVASVTLLALNTARKGATIVNTDANILYVDCSGGAATSSRHTHQLATGQTLEVPFGYTGLITGIWAADGAGLAAVVEFA